MAFIALPMMFSFTSQTAAISTPLSARSAFT